MEIYETKFGSWSSWSHRYYKIYIMGMSVGLTPNKKQARAPTPPNVAGKRQVPELYFNLIHMFYSQGI